MPKTRVSVPEYMGDKQDSVRASSNGLIPAAVCITATLFTALLYAWWRLRAISSGRSFVEKPRNSA